MDFALQLEDSEEKTKSTDVVPQLVTPEDDPEAEIEAGDTKGYVGTFTMGDGDFIVTTKKEEVVIRIPEGGLEPITRIPGQKTDSLVDGANVGVLVEFVQLEGAAEPVPEARQIVVKPSPQPPVSGAAVSVDTDDEGIRTLTIMRPDGTTKEVRLGSGVDSPETGALVTAFPGRGRGRKAGDGDGNGPPEVGGLVPAEQVLQRLEGFLQELTSGDSGLPEKAAERRAQRVAQVAAILETHADKHVKILETISKKENLPPQAMLGMLNSLDKAKGGRERAQGKAKAARDKVGPPEGRGRPESSGQPAGSGAGVAPGQGQSQGSQGQPGQGSQGRGQDRSTGGAQQEFAEDTYVDNLDPSHAGPGPDPTTESSSFHLTQGGVSWFSGGTVEYEVVGTEPVTDATLELAASFGVIDEFITTRNFARNDTSIQENPCAGQRNLVEWGFIAWTTRHSRLCGNLPKRCDQRDCGISGNI